MKVQLMKDLGDMNPGELEPKAWKGGDVSVPSAIIKSLPEKECMKARLAVFEAIVDEVIDDTIDEKEAESDAPVTDNDVGEVVEPIVDKAVALAIVPRSAYRSIANMIHSKIVSRKTRSSLLAKAAHFVAEAVTETDYNAGADNIDNPIDETVKIGGEMDDASSEKDESPASGTNPTTAQWRFKQGFRMDGDVEINNEVTLPDDGGDTSGGDLGGGDLGGGDMSGGADAGAAAPAGGNDLSTTDNTGAPTALWRFKQGFRFEDDETGGGESEDADDGHSAGADDIEEPTGESANVSKEMDDASSEEDETPAEAEPTTALWRFMRGARLDGDVEINNEVTMPDNGGDLGADTDVSGGDLGGGDTGAAAGGNDLGTTDNTGAAPAGGNDLGTVDNTGAPTALWRFKQGLRMNDDEYTAGADNIDNPINETVKFGDEMDDALSEKDETPAGGTAPTTAKWGTYFDADSEDKSDDEGDDAGEDKGDDEVADGADASEKNGDDIEVEVDQGLDPVTKANMRYLVKSAIHHQRATARVSRRLTAQLTDDIMYELRYALPAKFYNKYAR